MKIRVDISPQYEEKELIIHSNVDDDELQELIKSIKEVSEKFAHLTGYLKGTMYSLKLIDILFFETSDRNVYAHTVNDSYLIHYRLYELEQNLPDDFLRISKSAILNVNQIAYLDRSVTGNLVGFNDSYKSVYVSRRFLKNLKIRLEQRSLQNEK